MTSATATKKKSVRRNRSGYNFFYKHQRNIILREIISKVSDPVQRFHLQENTSFVYVDEKDENNVRAFLLAVEERPRVRRKHRRTHGMISLKELTETIARRWREALPDKKRLYHDLARQDSLRYRRELETVRHRVPESPLSNHIVPNTGSHFIQGEFTPRPIEAVRHRVPLSTLSNHIVPNTGSHFIQDEYTPRTIEAMLVSPESFQSQRAGEQVFTVSDYSYFFNVLLSRE